MPLYFYSVENPTRRLLADDSEELHDDGAACRLAEQMAVELGGGRSETARSSRERRMDAPSLKFLSVVLGIEAADHPVLREVKSAICR